VAAHDAAGAGGALPVFAMDPTLLDSAGSARLGALPEAPSGARESFDDALVVRPGRPEEVLPALVREVRAAGRRTRSLRPTHAHGATTAGGDPRWCPPSCDGTASLARGPGPPGPGGHLGYDDGYPAPIVDGPSRQSA